ASAARLDALGVRHLERLGAVLKIGGPADRQVPQVGRPAEVIDAAAGERLGRLADPAVLVFGPELDGVGAAGGDLVDPGLVAERGQAEPALACPAVEDLPNLVRAERGRLDGGTRGGHGGTLCKKKVGARSQELRAWPASCQAPSSKFSR